MTKFKSWLLVFAIHGFILWYGYHYKKLIVPKVKTKILVQTVIHTPPSPVQKVIQKKPVKATLPSPKPKAKPAPVKKQEKPTRDVKPVLQPKKPTPPAPLPSLPPLIQKLNIDQKGAVVIEEKTVEKIVEIMQRHLQLPEVGEVKLQLIIKRDGTLKHMSVLASKSERNQRYLETELPKLTFPPGDKGLFQNDEQTFTFIFSNCN